MGLVQIRRFGVCLLMVAILALGSSGCSLFDRGGRSVKPADDARGSTTGNGATSDSDASAASAANAALRVESERRETNAWFADGRKSVARAARFVADEPPARNVILFVGDGMGVATVTAARILQGQRRGESGEENLLAFERLPHVSLIKTYTTDSQVPDSAGTMTAIMTGVKTKTGVLGVDETIRRGHFESVAGARVPTLLEEAEARGLATGIVTTATVTHATPAGCYAHVPYRFWEDDARMSEEARRAGFPDIARQLVEPRVGDGLEVALGGGRSHFRPADVADPEDPATSGGRRDGRDLVRAWQSAHADSAYVWNREQLLALDRAKTARVLGLFEPRDMKWEAQRAQDRAGEPSLAEMTELAIDLLARDPDGYFLMVEGGRIDHGHHAGSAYHALSDALAFDDAVAVALVKTNPRETLVVVTADHSHTLTISGYPKRGNPILGKVVAVDWLSEGEVLPGLDALDRPYTTLSYANGPGYTGASDAQREGPHHFPHEPCEDRPPYACHYRGITSGRPDLRSVDTAHPDYLQEATIPMSEETHGGEDVPAYAGGARAALFQGVKEQSYLYHAMVEALGWTRAGVPVKR